MRVLLCVVAAAVLAGLCAAPARTGPAFGGPVQQQPNPERLKGMKAAVADIEAGRLRLKSPPLPAPPWEERYLELLKRECGVEWETVPGEAGGGRAAELGGYNDVMRVEIEHRFGRGVLEKLQKRAEAESRQAK